MRDFWQYLWSPGNHNKLEDRSFTKKTFAWTWIWTQDLLHMKPACYHSATVTWCMEVSKVGFSNSMKISRWPLFLSEINNSHTYLEITLEVAMIKKLVVFPSKQEVPKGKPQQLTFKKEGVLVLCRESRFCHVKLTNNV